MSMGVHAGVAECVSSAVLVSGRPRLQVAFIAGNEYTGGGDEVVWSGRAGPMSGLLFGTKVGRSRGR